MATTVHDESQHFDRQTHAYAEYRVFSQVARSGASHREVTVTLTRLDADGSGDGPVMCTISVTMNSGLVVQVQALERHPYAAIDRAATLVVKAVQRGSGRTSRASATSDTQTLQPETPVTK